MPIPLIVWGGVIGATAIAGVVKGTLAVKKIKRARKNLKSHQEEYQSFITQFENKHREVSEKINQLGYLKLEATELLGKVVEFLKNAKIKERDLTDNIEIKEEVLNTWEKASINATEVLTGVAGAAMCGASTATGVYGSIGLLASASTGTSISTLSGIAAQNATLAWLGGGTIASGGGGIAVGTVVLGGLIIGPALLISGFVLDKSASKMETQVEKIISQIEIDIEQKKKAMVLLDGILKRIYELMNNIKKLIQRLKDLLNNANPSNIEEVYRIAKLAKSLAELIETKVVDKDGSICN